MTEAAVSVIGRPVKYLDARAVLCESSVPNSTPLVNSMLTARNRGTSRGQIYSVEWPGTPDLPKTRRLRGSGFKRKFTECQRVPTLARRLYPRSVYRRSGGIAAGVAGYASVQGARCARCGQFLLIVTASSGRRLLAPCEACGSVQGVSSG